MRLARFIPTGVENTRDMRLGLQAARVHPHRRGEHLTRCASSMITAGSSPQAWGTHLSL